MAGDIWCRPWSFFDQFSCRFESTPDTRPGLRIHGGNLVKQFPDVCTVGVVFVRTVLFLFLIAFVFCHLHEVALFYHAKRTDDGQRHLAHPELGGHTAEMALVKQSHQCGMQNVILMMPQGYLVETEFLRQIEQHLPAIPRAEKARGFALVGGGVETGHTHMEPDTQLMAEILQITDIALVFYVLHPHMQRFHFEAGMVYLAPARKYLGQAHGILAARQAHENLVAILNELVCGHGSDKAVMDTFVKQLLRCPFRHAYFMKTR